MPKRNDYETLPRDIRHNWRQNTLELGRLGAAKVTIIFSADRCNRIPNKSEDLFSEFAKMITKYNYKNKLYMYD